MENNNSVLWNSPRTRPLVFLLCLGSILSSDLFGQPSMDVTRFDTHVRPVFATHAPNDATRLFVVHQGFASGVEAHATTVGLDTRIDLYNWSESCYERVDQFDTTTVDSISKVVFTESLSDYIRPSDNKIRARIDWRIDEPVLFFPWEIRLDQIVWNTD